MQDPVRYRRLLDLLEQALDQPKASRTEWLSALQGDDADHRTELTRLLAYEDDSKMGAQVDAGIGAMEMSSGDADTSAWVAGREIGGYHLEKPLGQGGMGVVWLARKGGNASVPPVAIKVPTTISNPKAAAERLTREGAILAALNHPNIARLIEVGVHTSESESTPFLAMEYVDGVRLPEYCDARQLSPDARLGLFVDVLDAVAYAHASLVLHRDLKPGNVLVTLGGEVKLLDFGIAKLLDDTGSASSTQLTQMAGRALTPDYASPEQIAGVPLTVASDVYSLGVMLFEMLTGERPYKLKRGSTAELEEAILLVDTSRPSTVVNAKFAERNHDTLNRLKRKLAGDLDTIVLKALKKKPSDRYGSVLALKDDIERYLSGRPVLATADSTTYRLRKFVMRNRLAVGAGAAILLALVTGLTLALWQAQAAREQARVAQAEAKLRAMETIRAEAVKDFLLSLFLKNTRLQPDPAAARAMTVTELLRSSSQKLRQGFQDQPQLKVELLSTVGTMLADLEDYKEAIELFREADALMQATGNILPDAQFAILHQRSMLAARMGAGAEALQIRKRMNALLAPPNQPTDLLKIKVYSVFLGSGLDDPKAIEGQLKMAIDLAERGYRNQPEYFMALYGLGYHYYSVSDYAQAEPILRKAVDAFAVSGSTDFRFHAQAKSQLANVMAARGRIRESIPIMEDALNDIRTRFGTSATRSRVFASIYAGVLANHGRTADAARILGDIATPASALKAGENPTYPALFASAYEAQMQFAMGNMKGVIAALTRYPEQFNQIARVEPNVAAGQSLLEAQAWEMLGSPGKSDATMNRIAQVNEGKTKAFFATSPPYIIASARIASHRGDFAGALGLLGAQGGAERGAGTVAPLPPAFNEDFANFHILTADILASSGDYAAAAESIQRTRVYIEKHAALADYPFLGAALLSTEGRVARLQGNFPVCIDRSGEALSIQRKLHAPSSIWMTQTKADLQKCEGGRSR